MKVLTSPQSVFLGIPVPVYGLVFFVAMFARVYPEALASTTLVGSVGAARGMSAVGILFALRLIYEELFVIRSLCLWCTARMCCVRHVRRHRDGLGGRDART